MKTAQQIKNLEEALVWWQTVPEANVSGELCYWRDFKSNREGPSCGTTACFGGWCAIHPSLVAQGVFADSAGAPQLPGIVTPGVVSKELFGHEGLFSLRDEYPADEGFEGSDHALVTNRIRWALEH